MVLDNKGVVYEQNIILKLSSEYEITVFDPNIQYASEVGKTVYVHLSVAFPTVEKINSKEKKILSNKPTPLLTVYTLYGEVLEMHEENGKQTALLLDIGAGTLEVLLDRADYVYDKFSAGDYVKVFNGRIDLDEIFSDNESSKSISPRKRISMRVLVVGRFQPFHLGHLRMLEYVASKEDLVVIGVGSSNKSNTKDNPFTLEERMEMIKSSVSFKNFEFAAIPDFGDNEKWVSWIKENVKFDVVYSNSKNEQGIFSSAGLEVKIIPFFEREKYSAIEVRRRMASGGDWKSLVPAGTLKVLEKIGGAERVRKLYALP